jgi:hypothetical protein
LAAVGPGGMTMRMTTNASSSGSRGVDGVV